jgi:hypothetical protein
MKTSFRDFQKNQNFFYSFVLQHAYLVIEIIQKELFYCICTMFFTGGTEIFTFMKVLNMYCRIQKLIDINMCRLYIK